MCAFDSTLQSGILLRTERGINSLGHKGLIQVNKTSFLVEFIWKHPISRGNKCLTYHLNDHAPPLAKRFQIRLRRPDQQRRLSTQPNVQAIARLTKPAAG